MACVVRWLVCPVLLGAGGIILLPGSKVSDLFIKVRHAENLPPCLSRSSFRTKPLMMYSLRVLVAQMRNWVACWEVSVQT